MYNRRYDRIVIVLKQETPGTSLTERPADGSAAIEIRNGKGKLSLHVQNVKPLLGDKYYQAYLLSCYPKQMELVPISPITVDQNGKGDIKWPFNPENVGGSGLTIESFNIVTVLTSQPGETKPIPALSGYKDSKINWKDSFIQKMEQAEAKKRAADLELTEQDLTEIELANKEGTTTDTVVLTETTEETATQTAEEPEEADRSQEPSAAEIQMQSCDSAASQETFHDLVTRFQQELRELESMGILSPEEGQLLPPTQTQEAAVLPDLTMPTGKDNPLLLSFFNSHNKVAPFANDSGEWIYLTLNESAALPFSDSHFLHNPFFISSYQKYKHLLLGKTQSKSVEYVFGIPDFYHRAQVLMASRLGFHQFICLEGDAPLENSPGYWLRPIS